MIIRDLEHCEQVKKIGDVEGGFFGFLLVTFDTLTTGNFTAVQGSADTINQQGNPLTGAPTVTGFSFSLQSFTSSIPFQISM